MAVASASSASLVRVSPRSLTAFLESIGLDVTSAEHRAILQELEVSSLDSPFLPSRRVLNSEQDGSGRRREENMPATQQPVASPSH